ncbi:Glutamyl-tRNA synthetase 2 [Gluconacetobacter sp. SXCC-1]|uniref:Glutamate--tRNA ligase n=1 Tax=Komagataeibacter rhaeticus TaxID=215221 RepID=A0A181C805_9PROT|nr:glutamate--tRNA ligase [Komagataeibacter rhaeticus]ATU73522.1 glutamate--tRNA ligase [Komagataeibacter xylinus]EGG75864.1 Glutamyl-tRNA synthetase 2 [Gluconacetobacter sp. SXCC-1]QIP34647.1 glutamate--tRNA ligase [Komagataeibacter rhaeticus]QOC47169.1 glutamate--tRNA ligase [Komagataeibacter rhaeticus]WPP20493.1 glutamate--tRNA ligase [Komagataeibacter rhaeticus]
MKLRFAPSPTGLIHVGNARQAIANALFARRHGARFLLRIDDTDRSRSKEEYVQALQDDLRWLGIGWDEFVRQSDRLDRYALAIEKLKASGRLYPCFESEQELASKREARIRMRKPPVYDRAMLRMTPQQRAQAEANGKVPYWRFKLSDYRTVEWNDLVMGPSRVKLPAISDPVLVRADGTVLYTLASVVDDMELGITHVIRGEDHVTNTGVQIDIAEALGAKRNRFTFAHLPLLLDQGGGKLSKRFDGLSIRALRQDGVEPSAIVSYLARLGSADDPEPLSFDELAQTYDLGRVSRSAARFDMRQLLGLNRRVMHAMPFEEIRARLPEGATEAFWLAVRGNVDMAGELRHWWDVVAGDIVPPVIDEADRPFLLQALGALPAAPWDDTTWKTWTTAVKEATGRTGRALFHPLRLALTGEESGPEMRDLLPLMGRARVADRLQIAAR